MPARSHDSRLVRRLLRSRKRGDSSRADDMEKAGGRRKDSAFAAAKDIHQKVAAGARPLNAFPYARASRGRGQSFLANVASKSLLRRWSIKSCIISRRLAFWAAFRSSFWCYSSLSPIYHYCLLLMGRRSGNLLLRHPVDAVLDVKTKKGF
jgi:hypothetical protein